MVVVAGAAKQCPGGSVFIPGLVFVDVLASVWVQPRSFSSQSEEWAVRDKTPGLPLCRGNCSSPKSLRGGRVQPGLLNIY